MYVKRNHKRLRQIPLIDTLEPHVELHGIAKRHVTW